MQTILQLEHVTKRFTGLVAVNDLSMSVEKNSIHALIGPNGSGKTTTLNMIHGARKATEGKITFKGQEITDMPTYKIVRMGMGRTFQNIKLFDSMSVLDNMMIGGHSETRFGLLRSVFDIPGAGKEEKRLRESAEEILNFLNMYSLKDEIVKNLPYGNQKVLELGRTLMTDPDLILLDEPAAGLNPAERIQFVTLLSKLHEKGKTLFLIEHNMDVVMTISDRITVLNFGAKIVEGTPKEVQNNAEVIKAYLGKKYQSAEPGLEVQNA